MPRLPSRIFGALRRAGRAIKRAMEEPRTPPKGRPMTAKDLITKGGYDPRRPGRFGHRIRRQKRR